MRFYHLLLFTFFTSLAFGQMTTQKTPLKAPAQPNMNLYRADAHPQQEIAQAVSKAARSKKRVILVFGGNWCGDCHVLDYAFHQPRIEPLLKSNYEVVHVDIGKYDRNLDVAKKYHVDLEKGVPSLVVLNMRGGLLYSTAQFERARLMTEEEVMAFLNAWAPPPPETKK